MTVEEMIWFLSKFDENKIVLTEGIYFNDMESSGTIKGIVSGIIKNDIKVNEYPFHYDRQSIIIGIDWNAYSYEEMDENTDESKFSKVEGMTVKELTEYMKQYDKDTGLYFLSRDYKKFPYILGDIDRLESKHLYDWNDYVLISVNYHNCFNYSKSEMDVYKPEYFDRSFLN